MPVLSFAQNINDVLNYSRNYYSGTARSASMGGAFGALGGDIGSLAVNPAGLGVFRTAQFAISPVIVSNETESSFMINGNKKYDSKYNFNINSFGIVGAYNMGVEDGFKFINFGVTYNRLANFYRNVTIEGINTNTSMLDYFVRNAQGQSPDNLDLYYERMAFDSYLIDTIVRYDYSDPPTYIPALPYNTELDQLQRKTITTEGGIGEINFAIGTNFNEMLFLGASFGVQNLRFSESAYYTEYNRNLDKAEVAGWIDGEEVMFTAEEYASSYHAKQFVFHDEIETEGSGYNFKIGAIIKPLDWLRAGIAYHSATFYTLTNEFYTNMNAEVFYVDDFGDTPLGNDYTYSETEPTDIDYNAVGPSYYNFDFISPQKIMASMGVVIGKVGIVSVDCERVNFGKTDISAHDYDYYYLQEQIRDTYSSANNIRIGGELRLNASMSLRGGYSYYSSPYKSSTQNNSGERQFFTGGFGINTGGFFLDFAYIYSQSEYSRFLYDVYEGEELVGADIISSSNKGVITVGFRF